MLTGISFNVKIEELIGRTILLRKGVIVAMLNLRI